MAAFLSIDLESGNGAMASKIEPSSVSPSNSSSMGAGTSREDLPDQVIGKAAVGAIAQAPTSPLLTSGLYRSLRYNFTTYRLIFALIFLVNIAILTGLVAQNRGSLSATSIGSASAVNLVVSVAFRQEHIVNALYWAFTRIPQSWPLGFRKQAAKVFHYGGVHSGCGVAAAVWYLLYTVVATVELATAPSSDALESVVSAWILLITFGLLLGGAFPLFRAKYHNSFEAIHRFCGWAVLAVFWAHVLFTSKRIASETSVSMGNALIHCVSFWCIILATLPVMISWSQLRKRSVRAEKLSDHAIRLYFGYTSLPSCYGIRVSTSALFEWHSFATIPDATSPKEAPTESEQDSGTSSGGSGFSLVISNAGDWTRGIIQNPPTHLWIRGTPLRGVLYCARLFRQVVIVSTGSGIGPCLSLLVCQQEMLPNRPRVFWSTPDPLRTFGEKVVARVKDADPEAVIWDTKKSGRPDLIREVAAFVRECGAEAVFCISNPKVSQMLVNGLDDLGIAAYAPIFDS